MRVFLTIWITMTLSSFLMIKSTIWYLRFWWWLNKKWKVSWNHANIWTWQAGSYHRHWVSDSLCCWDSTVWDCLLPGENGIVSLLEHKRISLSIVARVPRRSHGGHSKPQIPKLCVQIRHKRAHDFSHHHGHWASGPGWQLWSSTPMTACSAVDMGLGPPEAASETALMFQIKGSKTSVQYK